jgi:hypothetical protein
MGGVRGAGSVASPPAAGAAQSLTPSLSVLPDAAVSSDAMGIIYRAFSAQNAAGASRRRVDVEGKLEQEKLHEQEEEDALARQRQAEGEKSKGFWDSVGGLFEDVSGDILHGRIADAFSDTKDDCVAAWNSPQFWKDIAAGAATIGKWAAIAATAAALSMTGAGAAAVVVLGAMAVSAAGSVVVQTRCLGKESDKIGLGMELGGAAVATVASAGVAAGSSGVNAGLATMSTAGNAVSGGANVVCGIADIRGGDFQKEAIDAAGDAQAARYHIQQMQREVAAIVDDLKDSEKTSRRVLESFQQAETTKAQTMIIATARV